MFRLTSFALSALLFVAIATPVLAQGQATPPPDQGKKEDKKEEKKEDKKPDEKKQEKSDDEKKAEEYEKAIKDLPKFEGAFTFYQKKKDLLLELPDGDFGKIFLLQATMGTGLSSNLQAGDPLSWGAVDPFRFERHDDAAWLVRPNLQYRWSDNDPLKIAISRSYPVALMGQFKIEQTNPLKKLNLINVTGLFYGDMFRLSETVNMALGGQYGLDREKSGPDRVKSFPENSVITMKLHYFSPKGAEGNPLLVLLGLSIPNQLEDSRSAPLQVTYNMWYRKPSDYMPRIADPRIGYFTQDFYSFDKFYDRDRVERYIDRWNLKKKDPDAEISEPVKPIVWTLDPSIPPQYRDAVKKGILYWNKAFANLGYKDAVRVQEPPEDPDYDHADGRYNVVRWTMSDGDAYAVSLLRSDPFTGEILNAAVTCDANLAAFAVTEHQLFATPSASATARAYNVLTADPKRTETDESYLWKTDAERAREEFESKMPNGWTVSRCDYQYGLAKSASFAFNALVAGGMKVDKTAYTNEFISDVVSHEVGHCMGLRHNFVASTNLSVVQLADDDVTKREGIAASVMDYTPVNVMAVLKGSGNFYAPTVGPYDLWAIKYGYASATAATPDGEKAFLRSIASQSGAPGHAFMTDENADMYDPYVARFDSGKNPLDYSEAMLKANARISSYAIHHLPKPGEDYARRTEMLFNSIGGTFREGRMAARFVGGISGSRNYRADANERRTLKPVDPDMQRRAVRLITHNCLAAGAFNYPESVLNSLSLDQNESDSIGWTAPLREMISRQQIMLYSMLMSASTTSRIAENSFKLKSAKGGYRLDEHFSTLLGAVFSEVGANKPVGANRRDLQRFAINALITQAGAAPMAVNEDVRMLASDSLRRLSARFGKQLENTKGLDELTKVFLRDSKDQMDRFLTRSVAVGR